MKLQNALSGLVTLCLVGCGSSSFAPVSEAQHATVTDRLNGAFLWNCTMTDAPGDRAWRFVIQQEDTKRGPKYSLLDATEPKPQNLKFRTWGAAQIFKLKDGSEIQIASDGEARGEGGKNSRGRIFATGSCRRGTV